MLEIRVDTLITDPTNGVPVLLLEEPESDYTIPIWIGEAEAMSIAVELKGDPFPRPLTHDLMTAVLESMSSKLKQVIIDDKEGETYFATLVIEDDQGRVFTLDARPSDSIALALRSDSPLFMTEKVFEDSAIKESFDLAADEEQDEFAYFIEEEMDIEDFKKFT